MTTWTPKQVADLTARVNMKLRERQVEPRDFGDIGSVMADVRPGWSWSENAAWADKFAKVRLTRYEPGGPAMKCVDCPDGGMEPRRAVCCCYDTSSAAQSDWPPKPSGRWQPQGPPCRRC